MTLKDFLDILQGVSIIIASFVAIWSISSWRREAEWKRKYELAEEVLSLFYDISDRFDIIRSPAGYSGEGKTRKKNEGETTEESQILDKAYVVFERYEKEKMPFDKLNSMKYRFMALFGKDATEPFNNIFILRNRLLFSANILGRRYWQEQGKRKFSDKQFETHWKEMEKYEAIFWSDNDKDEFKEQVDYAINEIEKICKKIIEKK